jgi:heme A synthase
VIPVIQGDSGESIPENYKSGPGGVVVSVMTPGQQAQSTIRRYPARLSGGLAGLFILAAASAFVFTRRRGRTLVVYLVIFATLVSLMKNKGQAALWSISKVML